MNKATYDNASKMHTIIMTLGITMLMLLILVSLACAGSFASIPNSGSNNISNLNKSDEAITAYDKAIEINPQYPLACTQHSSAHHSDCHGHSLASGGNDIVPSTIYIGKTIVDLTYARDVNGVILQPKTLVKKKFPRSVKFGKNDLISLTANIGENVTFGDNCFVGANVTIRHDNYFGSNVIINYGIKILPFKEIQNNVTICHDSKIDLFNVIENNAVLGPYNKLNQHNVIGHYVILGSGDQFGSFNTIPCREPITDPSKVWFENNVTFGDFNTVDMNVQIGPYNHFGSYNRILENTSVRQLSFDSYDKSDSNNTFGAHKYDPADRILSSLYGCSDMEILKKT
jgi:acetyltransferase-like isoleucine patch superfamily enzyme